MKAIKWIVAGLIGIVIILIVAPHFDRVVDKVLSLGTEDATATIVGITIPLIAIVAIIVAIIRSHNPFH